MKTGAAALTIATRFAQTSKEKAINVNKNADPHKQIPDATNNQENTNQDVKIPQNNSNDTTKVQNQAAESDSTTIHNEYNQQYTETTHNDSVQVISTVSTDPSSNSSSGHLMYASASNTTFFDSSSTIGSFNAGPYYALNAQNQNFVAQNQAYLAQNQTYADLGNRPETISLSDSKLSFKNFAPAVEFFHFNAPKAIAKVVVNPEPNIFVKAANIITQIFVPEQEPPKATAVSVAGNGGGNQDTSSFVPIAPAPPIPIIQHEHAASRSFSINGNRINFESSTNMLFGVTAPGLSTVNASGALTSINLTGTATGIAATPYGMRAATSPTNVALVVGGNSNTPGTVLLPNAINTISTSLLVPGLIDLDFGPSNKTALFTSISVPTSIEAKVNVPAAAANAQLIFNFLAAPNTMTVISDYTPGADKHIVSIDPIKNLGTTYQNGVVINTNTDMAVIVFNHNLSAQQKLIYVDANDVVRGQGTFGVLNTPGALIKTADYNFIKPGDINGDNFSDFLFGKENSDNALLLYGKLGIPTIIDLANIPSTLSTTEFIVPSAIVGTVLAEGASPQDGGAALNALSATDASLKFIGDVNGDGNVDISMQRHSTNYAYDSDLVYVIEGQQDKFPSHINLLPYGDERLAHGIVGIGTDNDGNVVQNVKGFVITGTSVNNTVEPNNFAITSVGDVNGDGYSDLLALSNNNTAYMVFGHPDTTSISSLINLGGNLNTGESSPYVYKLFTLSGVASSTLVPTINDIDGGSSLNGDGLADIFFSSAIPLDALMNQSSPLQKYLTAFYDSGGNPLGSILSGTFFTDSSFNNAPLGSAYVYFDSTTHQYNTSHVITGFNGQSVIEGFTGIDALIAGTGNQTLIQHGAGTTNSHMPGVIGSTLIGAQGNDTFELADAAFHEVRGDTGFNTLRLNSGILDLSKAPDPNAADLASKASQIVTGIERIDLGDNAGLILDPSNLLALNSTSVTLGIGQSVVNGNVLASNITGMLLIASKNGSAQNPNSAPSVTLIDDDQHQWVANVPANTTLEGQGITSYALQGFTTTNQAVTLATLIVENNVQSHVASS